MSIINTKYAWIDPNYKHGSYGGENPYRTHLMVALRKFGLTNFSVDREFWTLGGWELDEYKELVREGFVFSPGAYHTVDHKIIKGNFPGIVKHEHTDFFSIRLLWKRPVVINFDSTMKLVDSNLKKLKLVVDLALDARKLSDRVLLGVNVISMWGNVKRENNAYNKWDEWLGYITHWVKYYGYDIEFCDGSHHCRSIANGAKINSSSYMLSFFCLIS